MCVFCNCSYQYIYITLVATVSVHWCHVIGDNRNPQTEVQWRRKLYSMPNSSIMIQLAVKTSGVGGNPRARPLLLDTSALPCSLLIWSALLRSANHLWCFNSAGKQSYVERKLALPEPKESWLKHGKKKKKSPGPWSILMQMRAPNKVWLVQNTLSWLVGTELLWLVRIKADGEYSCGAKIGWEKLQSYWLK